MDPLAPQGRNHLLVTMEDQAQIVIQEVLGRLVGDHRRGVVLQQLGHHQGQRPDLRGGPIGALLQSQRQVLIQDHRDDVQPAPEGESLTVGQDELSEIVVVALAPGLGVSLEFLTHVDEHGRRSDVTQKLGSDRPKALAGALGSRASQQAIDRREVAALERADDVLKFEPSLGPGLLGGAGVTGVLDHRTRKIAGPVDGDAVISEGRTRGITDHGAAPSGYHQLIGLELPTVLRLMPVFANALRHFARHSGLLPCQSP